MNLAGNVGELKLTIQITRAETGKVEEVELVSQVSQEELKALQAEGLIEKKE